MESEAAVLSDLADNTNKQMCLVEEPSQEVDQKVPEIQEDKATNDCDPEDETDQNMEIIDLLKASQSLTSSIKEDFSQLKEEVFKVFKERDTSPSSQAEHNPSTSVLNLLKEDLSQLKEDVSSIFSSSKKTKSMDPQTSQPTEKTTNRLSFLNFKDDLSSIFRIGLSKERDNRDATAMSESSNTFKTKAKRTDKPFLQTLFRRDQNISQKTENIQEVKKTFSETSNEQMDSGFRGNLLEQSEEMDDTQKINNNMKDRINEVEDKDVDTTVSDETTMNSETQQTEETIPKPQAAEQGCESEELSDNSSVVSAEDERINKEEEQEQEEEQAKEEVEEQAEEEVEEQEQAEEEVEVEEQEQEEVEEQEEEEVEEQEQEELQLNPSETLLWKPLSSGINLFNLRNPKIDNMRAQLGRDLWSVKNFAFYLTLDPNTANSELRLTDCNRMATRVWSNHRPSGHLDRFERCPQVLCRERLLDSVYWEVEWSVGADIGVTYNCISRDGDTASCLLGHNEQSWSLECSEGNYTPCHHNKRFRSSSPQPFTHRVGVYLNWPAGSLSFYSVSHDTMVHLHTFTSTFTEPLYPAFWVWAYQGSVSLRQVELDWERLLQ